MYKQKLFSYLQVFLLNIYLIRYGNSSGGHLENDKILIVSLVKTLEVSKTGQGLRWPKQNHRRLESAGQANKGLHFEAVW